ncbi:MAG: hypothetical protein U0441_34705 [Polyangiaceae bacterium]
MSFQKPTLLTFAALSLVACSGGGSGSAPLPTATAVTPAPALTATATATATATVTAQPQKPPRKAPRNYEALQAELAKKCPVADAPNNIEQKEAAARSVECLKKKMTKDLDEVLLPLKTSDKAKYDALMKEQAEWNRTVEKACRLEEERMWVDFSTGLRDDGTLRSYTYLGCYSQAYTERTMYARTLASGKVDPLAKHIDETQRSGAETRDALADILKKATAFQAQPAAAKDNLTVPDWKTIVDELTTVIGASKKLATSTCETWPDLAKALGGKEKCLEKAELYYYVQGNSPTVSAQ